MLISTSLWSGDLSNLAMSLQWVDPYTDFYHFDIMDGHYVRNFLFGPDTIKALRGKTDKPFEIHLMVEEPTFSVSLFREAGGDVFIFHSDTCSDLAQCISAIKNLGAQAGVALKPHVPVSVVLPVLEQLDIVLVLGTRPGFKNESLLDSTLPKVSELKKIIQERQLDLLIEVDGGIRWNTVAKLAQAGADIVVAGSIICEAENIKESSQKLHEL